MRHLLDSFPRLDDGFAQADTHSHTHIPHLSGEKDHM